MKKLLYRIFIWPPNFPFALILGIYFMCKIYKHTGIVEMEFIENDDITNNSRLKEYIKKVYPLHFKVFVSVVFWCYIIFHYTDASELFC